MVNENGSALDETWQAVVARSLAFLCLHAADLRDKDISEQAALLQALGLPASDIAQLVGSTEGSVKRLLGYRKQKGGRKRGSKTRKKTGRR